LERGFHPPHGPQNKECQRHNWALLTTMRSALKIAKKKKKTVRKRGRDELPRNEKKGIQYKGDRTAGSGREGVCNQLRRISTATGGGERGFAGRPRGSES